MFKTPSLDYSYTHNIIHTYYSLYWWLNIFMQMKQKMQKLSLHLDKIHWTTKLFSHLILAVYGICKIITGSVLVLYIPIIKYIIWNIFSII